jgi:hypothetical protein
MGEREKERQLLFRWPTSPSVGEVKAAADAAACLLALCVCLSLTLSLYLHMHGYVRR